MTSAERITAACRLVESTLLHKNKLYGDSAFSPLRVFSSADPQEQLRVRIDDKLSRLALVSLGIIYKLTANHHHHTDAIIKDHTESNNRLATAQGVHSEVMRRLIEIIERKF
jgi:hypothetical protein